MSDIIAAHKRYAEEIVRLYHGEEFIKQAEERYKAVAKGGIPENIKEINLSNEQKEMNICDVLVKTGLAQSKSEAKRMIQGNGVKVDGEAIKDINQMLDLSKENVVQFGKNKFVKVV